jgi:threonine dehydrogenase-like Zn-dependent dehydrogenase
MAEFFHVNHADANLVPLPDGVAPEAALMLVDMMSTGFHGAEMADISLGDTVVVIGIGPVGLMAIAGAALRGAGRLIAVGTRPAAIKVAESYGATEVVSYRDGAIDEQVRHLTGGVGADRVIVAGGGGSTLVQAIAMTRPTGIVSNVNFFDISDSFNIPALAWGLGMVDVDIRGGFCPGGAARMLKLLDVVRFGRCDPTRLISHTFHGFDRIPDAFELMDVKAPDLIKPVVFLDD